jgi:uncharacterized phage protein (TIGR02220 family)
MSVFGLIASSNFVIVNRDVMRAVGLEAAVLLSELASEEKYYEDNGMIDDGFFYSTIQNIESQTGLSKFKQTAALKVLESHGLLKCEVKGMPARRYFKLLPDGLQEIIYSKPVGEKLDNKKSRNSQTRSQETRKQEGEKLDNKFAKNSPEIISNTNISKEQDLNKDICSRVEPDSGKVIDGRVYEIVEYLNQKCHKHYRATSKGVQKFIHARLKDGATVEEMKAVIDRKAAEWLNDPRMNKYLRPETLFNETKFETYRQEEPSEPPEAPTALFNDIDLSQFEGRWKS